MKEIIPFLIGAVIALLGVLGFQFFGRKKVELTKKGKKYIQEVKKDEQQRIENMDPSDAVDELDNSADVRRLQKDGKDNRNKTIGDRIGNLLRRIGSKGSDKSNNT